MKNCLVTCIYDGLKQVSTYIRNYDEVDGNPIYEWTYGCTKSSWMTEKEAVQHAQLAISNNRSSLRTNIQAQKKINGAWEIIDLSASPYSIYKVSE